MNVVTASDLNGNISKFPLMLSLWIPGPVCYPCHHWKICPSALPVHDVPGPLGRDVPGPLGQDVSATLLGHGMHIAHSGRGVHGYLREWYKEFL